MLKRLGNIIGTIICIQLIFCFANTCSCFAESEISVFLNDEKLQTDVSPQITAEGRTLVPLRVIFEALGINLNWDDETKTITGTKNDIVITLQVGKNISRVNDREIIIDVLPQIVNGRTMVPVRFISESMGANVEWDEKNKAVFVSYQGNMLFDGSDIKYSAKVNGRNFLVYINGKWQEKFLKGVNIGAGKPGAFPGELAISKEEYLRWFKYISDMNADMIRVYTTQKPVFYDALFEFNKLSNKPLYLMHGVWVNEELISKLNDAYADEEKIKGDFVKDAKNIVDIIHGNAQLPFQYGFASGKYESDVSKYVIGWILGIEWDYQFVEGTNKNNPSRSLYLGKYLYTDGASPFEVFLCEVGDEVLSYEATKYAMFRPISYTNWPSTDMLKHPNEPLDKEDIVEVNVEHIKPQKNFSPGVFASYHIYPYYPDFMNYQKEYTNFKDDNGEINTYKAYLRDLFAHHTVPVLVAEFGVPASRGKAHNALYSGYNQGNHDEPEQGEIMKNLLKDIYDEGYCGGLVFAWQDEWFKRTWNTMNLDLPDTRAYWSNPQTNEQEFGLLAFDPGQEKCKCYVDGDISDWVSDKQIYTTYNISLFVKSDEKYVYLMAKTTNFDFNKDYIYIPVDSVEGQGNKIYSDKDLKFNRAADFLIQIKGQSDSRIFVNAHYDPFYFIYAEELEMIPKNLEYKNDNTGIFNPMYLALCRKLFLPEDKMIIPFSQYETGVLKYGNANPEETDFNSLADFCYKDGNIEIRIPWQLFNVMDPSTKIVMGDFYKNASIKGQKTEGFYFGAKIIKDSLYDNNEIEMGYYSWDPWTVPTFHERLKPSYYTLKDAFRDLVFLNR